ncbi:WD repeat-containing protein PCN-like isoform X1 [Senna tora]|uniref:WD repeat-containing protein PCN-like isoform X1 n=1 Tax=Senna tora TaxID=362788 RepID=A0A834WBR0_9FABA|nr:WD repeat-containing protein PCN-like isoform X1 [Senna tora]
MTAFCKIRSIDWTLEWRPSPLVALPTSIDRLQVAAARQDASLPLAMCSIDFALPVEQHDGDMLITHDSFARSLQNFVVKKRPKHKKNFDVLHVVSRWKGVEAERLALAIGHGVERVGERTR